MDKHCDSLTMRATLISHSSAYHMLVLKLIKGAISKGCGSDELHVVGNSQPTRDQA